MGLWVWTNQTSALAAIVVFLLAMLILLVWQRRQVGILDTPRIVTGVLVSIYIAALFSYTMLPFPSDAAQWCIDHHVRDPQPEILTFRRELMNVISRGDWSRLIRSGSLIGPTYNLLLFIPWGIIVRTFFRRGFAFTVVSALLVSVFIEITQATGNWGIFPCTYRLAEADDVLTNTIGAAIGALLATMWLWSLRGASER